VREKTVDMKMDTHLVPLIPGVTGVLGKIYPIRTLEKVYFLPLKYTLKKFQCRCMNPERCVAWQNRGAATHLGPKIPSKQIILSHC
jgi:hypothetical protein